MGERGEQEGGGREVSELMVTAGLYHGDAVTLMVCASQNLQTQETKRKVEGRVGESCSYRWRSWSSSIRRKRRQKTRRRRERDAAG